jgi:hypothetical protein
MAGLQGSYQVCSQEGSKKVDCASMDDFFQAFGEVDVEHPYLRVGDEYFPARGNLRWEEEEAAEEFSWPDWTEEPRWYRDWAKRWKKTYHCNDPINQDRSLRLIEGKLSPYEAEIAQAHLGGCRGCRKLIGEHYGY